MKLRIIAGIIGTFVLATSYTSAQSLQDLYNQIMGFSSTTLTSSYDTELQNAVTWMYNNGLTRYNSVALFMPNDTITREQAAKFFGEFAKVAYGKQMDKSWNTVQRCEFKDLNSADSTLRVNIVEACLLNIFYGSKGRFLPKQNLTNGQAITVAIRIMEGEKSENTKPWYKNYFNRADELNIIDGIPGIQYLSNGNKGAKRGEIAIMLYRGRLYGNQNNSNSCLTPWGTRINVGSSVQAYAQNNVYYGGVCMSETRTCQSNGVLNGSYQYSSCYSQDNNNNRSCSLPRGGSISNGNGITAYRESSVPFGSSCSSERRSCSNGFLNGSFQFSSCSVQSNNTNMSCNLPWGGSVAHGSSVTAWAASTVPAGNTCISQSRTCNNGVLNGSYQYSSCSVQSNNNPTPTPVTQQCTLRWADSNLVEVLNIGDTRTAYGRVNGTCQSQTLMCLSDGTIFGVFRDRSCDDRGTAIDGTVQCTLKWADSNLVEVLNAGDTRTAYGRMNGVCNQQTLMCLNDGTISGVLRGRSPCY